MIATYWRDSDIVSRSRVDGLRRPSAEERNFVAEPPRAAEASGPTVDGRPGTPRWVKVFGIVVIVLVVVFLGVILFGGGSHGPARHAPPSSSHGAAETLHEAARAVAVTGDDTTTLEPSLSLHARSHATVA